MAATPEYMQAVGTFVWTFSMLEWDVIYIAVTLFGDDWSKVPVNSTAGSIATALDKAIHSREAQLRPEMTKRLRSVLTHYRSAIGERNGLLHVHPYSAEGGAQQLGGKIKDGSYHVWTLERLQDVTARFAQHQREANGVLHELRA